MDEEAAALVAAVRPAGALDWDAFARAWWRAVRRVVLGDGARDDSALTDLLRELRSDANWAFLTLRRLTLRDRFDARLQAHLARAEPGSLAAVMATTPAAPETAWEGGVMPPNTGVLMAPVDAGRPLPGTLDNFALHFAPRFALAA